MVDEGSVPETGATGQFLPSSGSRDRRREERTGESRTTTDCKPASFVLARLLLPGKRWGTGGGGELSLTAPFSRMLLAPWSSPGSVPFFKPGLKAPRQKGVRG